MKIGVFLTLFLSSLINSAFASMWSSAVPQEIHLIPDGLVLVGDFDNTGVLCASGPRAIFLSRQDPAFKEKLSLALTAKATGKKIQILINDPIEFRCIEVTALGNVPIAHHYFWQLKD